MSAVPEAGASECPPIPAGARVSARATEWFVRGARREPSGRRALDLVALSGPARSERLTLLDDLEAVCAPPSLGRLSPDHSPFARRARVYLDAALRRTPGCGAALWSRHAPDASLALAAKAALWVDPAPLTMPGPLEPAALAALLAEFDWRARAERVLVIVDAARVDPLQASAWERSHFALSRVDATRLGARRDRALPGANPFHPAPRLIISSQLYDADVDCRRALDAIAWDLIAVEARPEIAAHFARRATGLVVGALDPSASKLPACDRPLGAPSNAFDDAADWGAAALEVFSQSGDLDAARGAPRALLIARRGDAARRARQIPKRFDEKGDELRVPFALRSSSHPVYAWLDERALALYDHDEIPVAPAAGAPAPGAFVFQAIFSNLLGAPALSAWFAVIADARAPSVVPLQELLTGLDWGRSRAPLDLDALAERAPEARVLAREHALGLRRARSAELARPLSRTVRRARARAQKERDALRAAQLEPAERVERSRELARKERRFEAWIDRTLRTDPEPYLRLTLILSP